MGLPLNITVERHGSHTRLVVSGEIDMGTSERLFSALEAAISGDASTVDVDLSDVWFLDSCGIEVLVRAQRLADARVTTVGAPCQLRILRPSGVAGGVLRAAGIHGYIEIVDHPPFAPAG